MYDTGVLNQLLNLRFFLFFSFLSYCPMCCAVLSHSVMSDYLGRRYNVKIPFIIATQRIKYPGVNK